MPRETAADLDGSVDTLDRKLKERVYLMVEDKFPTTELLTEDGDSIESLLEAALRGLDENLSGKGRKQKKSGAAESLPLDLYCPSQAPLAVKLDVFDADKQKTTGLFGTKTFFVKVQYDDGKIKKNQVDFAWLNRTEIVDRIQETFGDNDAKFYKYML